MLRSSIFAALPGCALSALLLGAAPAAVPPNPSDGGLDLRGTWSCRDAYPGTDRIVYTPTSDGLQATISVSPTHLRPYEVTETLQHDAMRKRWTIVAHPKGWPVFIGRAGEWSGATWVFDAESQGMFEPHVRYERLGPDMFRRELLRVFNGREATLDAQLCRRGTELPAESCVVRNLAPSTLEAAQPVVPRGARGIAGDVDVVISLDASSNITSARVVRSPSELLNEPALDAARHSVFRTEIRDCRPVARDFLFIVTFHG